MIRIGIDVGGTFTDLAAADEKSGAAWHFKLPSTPADPAAAIGDGVAGLLHEAGASGDAVAFLGHGTTVVTNLIIERRGAATALLTTAGFRDVLEIGRQTRPDLYDYTVERAPPLVPRHRRVEIPERLDADGEVLVPLDEEAVERAAVALRAEGIEAVAIGFLHAYRNDIHERRAAEIVRRLMPEAFIALSSEVLPEFREYERLSTTVINAYAVPRMAGYLAGFARDTRALECRASPYVFHSNGGLMSIDTASRFPVRTCLSGPAAGVIGAAAIGVDAGFPDLVTFDVGGTSTDVSLVKAGRPAFTVERMVAGYPVRVPMIDIQVIGAGGGSIAALDVAGALKVGPMSAGADPGPAGYGRGGEHATITDANLLLGRLNPGSLLGGRLPVDLGAARRALKEQVAGPLRMSLEQAAEGILRIAIAGMARAIRSISTERGHDLRDFALFAYGGAGPLHAGDVAGELGIPRVIVPGEPGTLCARGILHADLTFDLVQTRITPARPECWAGITEALAEMAHSGSAILDREGIPERDRRIVRGIDARYEGQNFEVYVALDGPGLDADPDALHGEFLMRFRAAHRAIYGYDIPDRAVEIVTLRLTMIGFVNKPKAATMAVARRGQAKPIRRRSVYFVAPTGWLDTPIYDRAQLPIGSDISGPAVIEEMSATTLLHPGRHAVTDKAGNLIITTQPSQT
ncbi:MAG: hydantoinase/oxoprolinase family protein [Alphaproteobacteria bacterium]|nr:hydantoinase/oxoprolinase family protein [Alphaproteobacteria bacterium]